MESISRINLIDQSKAYVPMPPADAPSRRGSSRLRLSRRRSGVGSRYRQYAGCGPAHTFERGEQSFFIDVPVVLPLHRGSTVLASFAQGSLGRHSAERGREIIHVATAKHFTAALLLNDTLQRSAIGCDDRLREGHVVEELVRESCVGVFTA